MPLFSSFLSLANEKNKQTNKNKTLNLVKNVPNHKIQIKKKIQLENSNLLTRKKI
jgi:hypothetical protein